MSNVQLSEGVKAAYYAVPVGTSPSEGAFYELDMMRLQNALTAYESETVKPLRETLERAEHWNNSVAVCAKHTEEVVGGGCIVCENAGLREELERMRGVCEWEQAGCNWRVTCGAVPYITGRPAGAFCPNCGRRVVELLTPPEGA
jgi:hypothetical protein